MSSKFKNYLNFMDVTSSNYFGEAVFHREREFMAFSQLRRSDTSRQKSNPSPEKSDYLGVTSTLERFLGLMSFFLSEWDLRLKRNNPLPLLFR